MKRFRRGVQYRKVVIFVILCLIAISTLFPLVFLAYNTFKTESEYTRGPLNPPTSLFLANYSRMFSSYGVLRLLWNTVTIVAPSIALAVFFGSLAAYTFAKTRLREKRYLFFYFISLMVIPLQVLMLPLYMLLAKIHLINTKLGMVGIYFGVMLPFALYFLTVNFRTVPDELMESARIDGAGFFRIYRSIMLPMGRTALITLCVLDFVWIWNELVLSFVFLQSEGTKTITAGVATVIGGLATRDIPLFFSGLFLNEIPVLLLYPFAARFLAKGISLGAVKG